MFKPSISVNVCDNSHIMIDLILVNEDTRVLWDEISIQDGVSGGAGNKGTYERFR